MINQLGRYEIVGELGQGAMGIVYKAKDPLIDRIVAIKTINLSMAQDEKDEYEARFYQEAKAAGRLSHPNIVTVFDVGKSDEIAYIAMEFLQGRELRDVLTDGRRMPVQQVVDIVAQVAQGLAYAHEHGIVHRDVKPSNVMIVRDGHVKITDFGIARMASSTVRTQTGMVLGSPKYMSPEQVMGKLTDQRSDIFSLGVMLYEMLAGQPPFTGENVNAVMYQTLNATPPPPASLNPEVPGMLNFIVAKALAKSVDDRYANASDFANDLRACRDSLIRGSGQVLASQTQTASAKVPDAMPMAGRFATEEADITAPQTMGLSPAFDSMGATMRLAALTNAPEEVEEVAKTLRMMRPTMDAINQVVQNNPAPAQHAPPKPATPPPPPMTSVSVSTATIPMHQTAAPATPRPVTPTASNLGNWLMLGIVLLVVLGVALVLIF